MTKNNAVVNALGHITTNIKKEDKIKMEIVNNRIDQMINEVHVFDSNKTGFERVLDQEKEQLKQVPLLPEESREERTKQILNYCEMNYKRYCQDRFRSDKEMYKRECKSKINEIFRRAKDKIVKLDDIILELNTCKTLTNLSKIEAKMPSVW